MLKVHFYRTFLNMYRELLVGDPNIRSTVDELIFIFRKNPNDTRLKNHKLSGKMTGQFAFSITEDIRIVYEVAGKNTVRFLAIGPHEKVY